MQRFPNCPSCKSDFTYNDGDLLVCPQCGHEWRTNEESSQEEGLMVKDAYGNRLNDGDTISLVKDLKIKGSSSVIKVGTKVKNIRLTTGDHNIDCKIEGIGPMQLKSEFVKKA